MKKHPILIAATLVAGFAFAQVHAQDGQSVEPGKVMPLDKGSLLPSVPEGLILAPPPAAAATPPATPSESEPDPTEPAISARVHFKKGTAEELRQAIRIRELKTLVQEYPSVQAQKKSAECAKTNAGRCVAMRNYYTLLYTNIQKLDPSLHDVLEERLHDILARFEQHTVCPSVLIEPIAELPGSHSADHVVPGGKPAAQPKHPSKKRSKKMDFGL